MRRASKNERFVPPIMQAFRAAFRDKDSAKVLDIRTDEEERVIAGRRSSPRNAVNEAVLRQELAADLDSLLNTINFASAENLDGMDFARASILNYGVADLTAISADENTVESIGEWLRVALERFESRLVANSLNVVKEQGIDEESGHIRFHVQAEMHSNPSNTHIEFVADIETNNGKMRLSQR